MKKLPKFGIGPFYVIGILLVTILALVFSNKSTLNSGRVETLGFMFILVGILAIILGARLWIEAVLFQKITKDIEQGKLVTTGVYGIVRNPIYSAFTFVFSGFLLLAQNWYLLVLPIFYWFILTILLKETEEKWLTEKFGDEYTHYCHSVNRIIPWF